MWEAEEAAHVAAVVKWKRDVRRYERDCLRAEQREPGGAWWKQAASAAQKVVDFTIFPGTQADIGYCFTGTKVRLLALFGAWWKPVGVCCAARSLA